MSLTGLGVFEPGWVTPPVLGVSFQETFVGITGPVGTLHHRVGEMHGNRPFVYLECAGFGLADHLAGELEGRWRMFLNALPANCHVSPLAEMNGRWVPWHGPPELYRRVFGTLQAWAVDQERGDLVWCWSPAAGGHPDWLEWEPESYDVFAPSFYDHAGDIPGYVLVRQLSHMARRSAAGHRTVLAQTGTAGVDRSGWLAAVLEEADRTTWLTDVVYFNANEFRMPVFP